MGLAEILTLIFVVLKLVGLLHWAWWVCFLPVIITYVIAGVFMVGALALAGIVAYFGSK